MASGGELSYSSSGQHRNADLGGRRPRLCIYECPCTMRPRRFRRVTAGVMVPGGRCLRRGPERPGRGTDAKGLVLGDHAPGLRHHAGAALEMLTAKSSRSARSLLPAVRHPGPLRRAVLRTLCSSAVSLVILGLFAFPGSGGQDPYHIHVVIGSTPAERARALAQHLLRERAGIDSPPPAAVSITEAFDATTRVRVFSVRRDGGCAPAVFARDAGGATLASATWRIPAPAPAPRIRMCLPLGCPQTAPSIPEPPPRYA